MKTLERTEDHGEEGWGRMTVCGLVESGGPAPRRPRPPPKASSPAPCRDSASSKLHSLFAAEEVGGGWAAAGPPPPLCYNVEHSSK